MEGDRFPGATVTEMALNEIRSGSVVGLGSGRAATGFINALGARVREGLEIRGVPTSRATAELATALGIPLVSLGEVQELDLTIDGADEVDPQLNLIKGYGGAMVREKVVAAASARLVIIVGPGKQVPCLGQRGTLPVEIVPFAVEFCRRRLRELGLPATHRREPDGEPFVSDNNNMILDCVTGPIADPAQLDCAIRSIPGVVGTGLFLGMASVVLIQESETVVLRRIKKSS